MPGELTSLNLIMEGERRNLSSAIQVEVYCIAREVLRNAFRYAEAHQIEAEIRYDDQEFRLRIRDDGKGIDPRFLKKEAPRTLGITGVREPQRKSEHDGPLSRPEWHRVQLTFLVGAYESAIALVLGRSAREALMTSDPKLIRILTVDDHPVLRQASRRWSMLSLT